MIRVIITCPNCSQSLRVPLLSKELQVTCSKCNESFIYGGRYKDTDVDEVNGITVLRSTGQLVNGVVYSYHGNGNVSVEVPYKGGIKEGIARYYYKSGGLESETPYKNNVVEGIERVYYESGELRGETPFRNDKRGGKSADPKQFGVVAHTIAVGLERVRELWFAECVEVMEGNPDCAVVNRNLGGNADLAIKALQLLNTVTIIADKQYVSRSNGPFFSDILFAEVCGTGLERVMPFFNRYVSILNDKSAQLMRFSIDIVAYILGNDNPDMHDIVHIPPLYPAFVRCTWQMTAYGFGDPDIVKYCQEKLNGNPILEDDNPILKDRPLKVDKPALIRSLVHKRISENPITKGMGWGEMFKENTNQLSSMQLLAVPEGSIVTMVETYVIQKNKGMTDRDIFMMMENHRSMGYSSARLPEPLTLESFIKYRIKLETQGLSMPIDEKFIDFAIKAAMSAYTAP